MPLGPISILFASLAGGCVAIALINLFIYRHLKQRNAFLALALFALSLAAFQYGELLLIKAGTIAEYGEIARWMHVPVFLMFVALLVFIRHYFGTGRLWLAYATFGARALALVLNFVLEPNLNYSEITALRHVTWSGESIATAVGTASPWIRVGEISSLLLLIFMADAIASVWRRGGPGDRRRSLWVGGSLLLVVLFAAANSYLIHHGAINSSYLFGIFILALLIAITTELLREIARSALLKDKLHEISSDLLRYRHRMEMVLASAEAGMWEWNIERDEIWLSEQAQLQYRLQADKPIKFADFLQAIHLEDRDSVEEEIRKSVSEAGRFRREYRTSALDDEARWVVTRGGVEANEHAEPIMRGITVDISEKKSAEQRLQQEREFLRQILDINPNLIFAKDRKGRFTVANQAVADMYGTTTETLVGKTDADFNSHHDEVEGFQNVDQEVMETQQRKLILEERITDVRGRVHWLQTVKLPVFDRDGRVTQVLGTATDITERKKIELDMAAQRNELAHLSRAMMLSELSGSIAHELNQPLTAILSNAQAGLRIISQGSLDPQVIDEILRDVVIDSKRAGEIIGGLRQLLKKEEMRLDSFDANKLVIDVLRLLRSDMLNAGVSHSTDLLPTQPAISGVRVQLQQVIMNLLINACEAMAQTSPTERLVSISTTVENSEFVKFSVRDRGHGFSEVQATQLFEPFFTTKRSGMGLGLVVCRRIVEAHGGRLWGTPLQSSGAEFCFTIPICRVMADG